MEYKVNTSLWDFPAWSGDKDTLDKLKDKDDVDAVEEWIEGMDLEDATDTTINDILWFDRDAIAEELGYRDWDAYEEGWSLDDLKDAVDWWEDLSVERKASLAGIDPKDYEDRPDYELECAIEEWWDNLEDKEKVETYYLND